MLNNSPAFRGNRLADAVYLGGRRLWTRPETLSLDFANDVYRMGSVTKLPTEREFSELITFTRGSGGGITNAQGNYEWLGNDVPRFDCDPITKAVKGLLIEEQRTNLLRYSEQFDGGWKVHGSTIDGYVTAPDGTAAPIWLASNTAGLHRLVRAGLSGREGNTVHTGSFYVHLPAGHDVSRLYIRMRSTGEGQTVAVLVSGSGDAATFTFKSSGPFGTNAPPLVYASALDVSPVGNGWHRIAVTSTTSTTTNQVTQFDFGFTRENTEFSSGSPNTRIAFFGAQLEQGSFPTSYIPTKATFTARNSIGTYHDNQGVLRTAAANIARYDHGYVDGQWVSKGLLLEEKSTNLLTQSDSFGHSSWEKARCSVLDSQAIAPDGTITADKLIEGDVTGSKYIYKGGSVTEGVARTLSVYAKAAERNFIEVNASNTPIAPVRFDLTTGVVTITSANEIATSATPAGDGWWRLSVTVIPTVTGSMNFGFTVVDTATGSNSYQGDGTSGIYIWGAQLEAGDRPTSYIPTPAVFTSRASTKTYFDAQGVMRTAAEDEAAIDHGYIDGQWVSKGLSVEGQATNLLTQSEAFDDDVSWGKASTTVTANSAVAPDGTSSADLLTENVVDGSHYAGSTFTTAAGSYTLCVYVKAAGRQHVVLAATSDGVGVGFNLLSGQTFTQSYTARQGTGTLTPVGGGWFRCAMTWTSAGANNGLRIVLNNSTTQVYTGDGTSGIYIWGAQLEAGSQPTSYIPTTTAQVTRAADVTSSAQVTRVADSSTSSQVTRAADMASVNDLSGWYRQDEGTLVVEAEVTSRTPTRVSADIGAGGAFGTTLYLSHTASVSSGSPAIAPINAEASVPDTALSFKNALAMRKNELTVASNGVLGSTDKSYEMPMAPNKLTIGNGGWRGSISFFNGHIKSIKYLPRRVSNDELKALSV